MTSIVVTGLGAVSPVGNSVETFWSSLCSGTSGLRPITRFDASSFRNNLAGEVRDFTPDSRDARDAGLPPACCYAAAAVRQALESSGVADDPSHPNIAIVLATNFGAAEIGRAICRQIIEGGGELPTDASQWQMQRTADYLAEQLELDGPRSMLSLSCASGVAAIGEAMELIRSGKAQAAIAGGFDELSFYAYTGLSALRAITPDIIRPFDKNRKGTLFAEGAGALVLESEESAKRRGAVILAEAAGCAMNNDAYHMTAPDKTGRGIISVMRKALADAGVNIDEIDHVNAHGTGTQFNDKTETTAIKEIFGERAHRIPVNSMKSMLGHTMGASGALEAIGTILTLRDGIIPPTVNLETPDPECDLDYVPGKAREMAVKTALCNSYGFGGTNAAAIFRRWRND